MSVNDIIINEAYIFKGEVVIVAEIDEESVVLYDGLNIPIHRFIKEAKIYTGEGEDNFDVADEHEYKETSNSEFIPNIETDEFGIPILKKEYESNEESYREPMVKRKEPVKTVQANPITIMYEKAKNKDEMKFGIDIQIPMFNHQMIKVVKETFEEEEIDGFVSYLVDKFVTIDNIKKILSENLKTNFI